MRGAFEATFSGLGHACRKLGLFREAAAAFGDALLMAPGRVSARVRVRVRAGAGRGGARGGEARRGEARGGER